ncbi:tetratricopeptide repeat protein [Riemerella columbina]|uniref:tetratricopeptide repeat protein n=1 Tax=Riemerella columbina TaxID=103810 RepID=UPI00266FA64D|nr:tetratricopeptide repeat protein [Riemerella columbina]WKS96074.1 tetratricopeptide repeat protein [Riemerella columbina]
MFRSLIISVYLVLGCFVASAQSNYNTLMYKGNQSFDKKDYDQSANYFLESLKNKDDFGGHYNLGNSFYKKKMYPEAKAEYEKALTKSKNPQDQAAAYYNLGNVAMQNKNYEQAAEFYKKALKQDAYNEDIRKNYALSKMKQKEKNSQNKNQKQDSEQSQDPQNQKEQPQQGNPQNQSEPNEKQSQQAQGENQQKQGKGEGEDTQNNDPKQPTPNRGISKEQEQRILQRLESKERETARRILNKNGYISPKSNDKDW